MGYQSELRGLMKEKREWSEGKSAAQDVGMLGKLFGEQIVRRDTAWDQAKKGFLQTGGKEEDWQSVRDKDKPKNWWEKLIVRPLQTVLPGGHGGYLQGPEGGVDIGDRRYDLENLKKIGSFQELLGADPSAYTGKDGSAFGDIMEEYTKTHAPGSVIPPPLSTPRKTLPKVPMAYDPDIEFGEDIKVEGTDFDEFGEWDKPPSLEQAWWGGGPPTEEGLSETPYGEGEYWEDPVADPPIGQTFSPKYDLVKDMNKRRKDRMGLQWQNRLFNRRR